MNSEVIENPPTPAQPTQPAQSNQPAPAPSPTPTLPAVPANPSPQSAGFTQKPPARFTKKQKIAAAIIAGVVTLAAIAITIFLIFSNRPVEISTVWGQKYYDYLLTEHDAYKDGCSGGAIDCMFDNYISFIEIDGLSQPAMLVNYGDTDDNKASVSVLRYLAPSGAVSSADTNGTIGLYYNVKARSYNYYDYRSPDGYASVADIINSQANYDPDGSYIKVTGISIGTKCNPGELDARQIGAAVERAIANYQPKKELIPDNVKSRIEKQSTKLEGESDSDKDGDDATDSAPAEESSEPAEDKGLKVGDHYLKHGKYQSSLDAGDWLGGTYTINSDKTFVYENDYTYQGAQKHVKQTGTYQIVAPSSASGDSWMIKFTATTTDGDSEMQARTDQIWDVDADNQFHAHQYLNIWTFAE